MPSAGRKRCWSIRQRFVGVLIMDDSQDDHSWAARYRLGASEARQRAATVKSEKTRQELLKIAAEYDELAAERERMAALKDSK